MCFAQLCLEHTVGTPLRGGDFSRLVTVSALGVAAPLALMWLTHWGFNQELVARTHASPALLSVLVTTLRHWARAAPERLATDAVIAAWKAASSFGTTGKQLVLQVSVFPALIACLFGGATPDLGQCPCTRAGAVQHVRRAACCGGCWDMGRLASLATRGAVVPW